MFRHFLHEHGFLLRYHASSAQDTVAFDAVLLGLILLVGRLGSCDLRCETTLALGSPVARCGLRLHEAQVEVTPWTLGLLLDDTSGAKDSVPLRPLEAASASSSSC